MFPDLRPVMSQLHDTLLSTSHLEIDLNRKPYCAVIQAFGGRDSFIEMAYDTVLPELKNLQGKPVTAESLHHVRREQAKQPSIWDRPHGGYLNFVTDRRDMNYWRPYIGQAGAPKIRISTHHSNVQAGHQNSLHYWIIKIGEGQRQANFIRLWTISFPPKVDDMVKLVFENFLEKVMCRAFQSLPPATLKEFFGPSPCSTGEYSGLGLNVVSPLYQGKRLGTLVRHKISQKWDQSPDPDICRWSNIRSAARDWSDWSPLARPPLTRKDYYGIMREAIFKNLALKESFADIDQALPAHADQISWALLEENLETPESWFKAKMAKLQEQSDLLSEVQENGLTQDNFICPVGTSKASIGVVFGSVPSYAYNASDGAGPDDSHHMPWGLKESGLDHSNSLIWSYTLQKFTPIPGNFQSYPPSASMMKFFKSATQELIFRSKLRIVIMCGDEVQRVVLADDLSASTKITFMLHGMECSAWIQHDGSKILRLFIQCPSPLTKLWSSHGRAAYEITNLFRFVSGILDVTICPWFYESSLVVALAVRGWYDEQLGRIPPTNPKDLNPILRLWLAEKGFKCDTDLFRLAQAANGSLRRGIQILCSQHPRRLRGTSSQRLPRSQTVKSSDPCSPEILSQVVTLFKEKAPHLFTASQASRLTRLNPRAQELECVDESSVEEATAFGILPPDTEETLSMPEQPNQLDEERKRSIRLMLGSKHKGNLTSPNNHAFTIRQVGFTITTPLDPAGGFWIKAELAPIGERHPHVWAQDATQEDPGSRLAIRFGIRDSNGDEIGVEYPSAGGWRACYKANRIVDELNGDTCLQSSKRPRRHVYVDARHKRLLRTHPELEKFVGGAYIGDNGEFISPNRIRSKRRRENGACPGESGTPNQKRTR